MNSVYKAIAVKQHLQIYSRTEHTRNGLNAIRMCNTDKLRGRATQDVSKPVFTTWPVFNIQAVLLQLSEQFLIMICHFV